MTLSHSAEHMGRGRRAALGFWLDLAFGFALRRDGESSRVASAFFACAKQSTQKKAHPWLCAAATQQYPAMLARKGATETRPRGETKAQISRRSDQNKSYAPAHRMQERLHDHAPHRRHYRLRPVPGHARRCAQW